MLSFLRKKAQSPIIQATVVIIALVFIFWGVGTRQRGGGNGNAVATVNDEAISFQQYQKAYDRNVTRIRNQFGGNIPKGLLESMDIKSQVLEQLIQKVLLQQGAREMGIRVSKEEVKNAIQKMEAFRTDGIFNLQQYEAILSANRMTPAAFESSVHTDLLVGKVMEGLGQFAQVPAEELKERFLHENEELKLEYVSFEADHFKEKVQVDDDKLSGFYEQNKQKYESDPQVKLSYLAYPYADATDKVEVSDEEIENYYEQNINRYTIEEKRSARHILFKTSEDDPPEVRKKKFQQAEEVLKMARAGKDFSELAKKYSEGPSAARGGDLGSFGRGQMIKPFEDAVFSLKEGEISDIVETSFGYHIIKLEKIEKARIKPLDEVRESIKATLAKEKVKNQVFAEASKAYEDIILAGSLQKYAASGNVQVEETDFFERKAPPAAGEGAGKDIVHNPTFLNAAFSLKKGELSSLVDTGQAYAIIYMQDRKAPEIRPLAEVKEQVKKDYIDEQAETLAKEAAEKLLATLRTSSGAEDKWQEETEKLGLKVQETDFVSRSKAGAIQQVPAAMIEKGFRLTPENPYPDTVETKGKTFLVYRFKEKKEPDPELFQEKKKEIEADLLVAKKQELLAAWLENQKHSAKITTNQELL